LGTLVVERAMRVIQNFLRTYLLAIVTGLLIGTSYIPFQPWAIFFGLVPLFLFWSKTNSLKEAFIAGWVSQFVLTLIGFHWVAYTAIEFGHFPVWGGVLTLIGFASIAHLHYAFGGLLAVYLTRKLKIKKAWFFVVAALCFAACETQYPMIFPWHLGYPWLWAKFPGAQFADVIGFEGLNLVTIAVNALAASAIAAGILVKNPDSSARKRPYVYATIAAALIMVVNFLGNGRDVPWRKTDASVEVLAVQGNIGNFDKLMVERGRNFRVPIIEKYIDLSREGLAKNPGAQIMIWPETAFPDVLDQGYQNDPSAATVRQFVRDVKVPLLTGSYSYDPRLRETYNGFFYVHGDGSIPEPPYRKSILLVFGETFPFSEYIPYMTKLFPDLGAFGRGNGPSVMTALVNGQELKVGAQICYEGLYPWFTAGLSKKGAQILTNVTNDSWFGTNFEPHQHLYMTLARAIEVRRPLVRSTNTGITTVVLASGDVLEKSPIGVEWAGSFKVPFITNPAHTFYERFEGAWFFVLVFGLIAVAVFAREPAEKK
jgi:apolipoprotein N-acyltransferase